MAVSNSRRIFVLFREATFYFLIIWLINPQSRFSSIYNWNLYGGALILWIILSGFTMPRTFKNAFMKNRIWMVWLYPSYLFIASLLGHAQFSIYQFTIPFIYIFFHYYSQKELKKQMTSLIYIFGLYYFIININTLNVNQSNFQVSRLLASGNVDEIFAFSSPFIGGFAYIYSLIGISVSMIGLSKYYSRMKKSRIFVFLFAVLCINVIIKSQYMIALLLTFVLIMLILFIGEIKTTKGIMKLIVFIFLCISFILISGPIFAWMSRIIEEPLLSQRFEVLSATFNGNNSFYSLRRMELYLTSINTFKNNFIFGVGDVINYNIVGGHSQILDTFAKYGIIGGALFIISLSKAYTHVKSKLSGRSALIYKYSVAAFFMQSLVNRSYYDLELTIYFFIIPMILYLYDLSINQRLKQRCPRDA